MLLVPNTSNFIYFCKTNYLYAYIYTYHNNNDFKCLVGSFFLIFNHNFNHNSTSMHYNHDIHFYNNYNISFKRVGIQSARYTSITLDLFFGGIDDDSRESKHVVQG